MKSFIQKATSVTLCLGLLLTSLAGCGGAASNGDAQAASKTAASNQKLTLNLCSPSYSPGSPRDVMSKELKQKLEEGFPGRIDVMLLTPGSLGGDKAMYEAVQMGSADMVILADTSIDMVLGNLSWAFLPFMMTSYEDVDEHYYQGWVAEEIEKRINASGVVKVGNYESGFRNFANKVRPITKMEDFKGLKTRVPELSYILSYYEKLGTLPVTISAPEVVTALEQGTVDGQDNNIMSFQNTGTLELCKYILKMNYTFAGGSIVVGQNFFNKLTADEQAKFKEICSAVGEDSIRNQRQAEEKVIADAVVANILEISEPSAELVAQLREISMKVWDEESVKHDKEIMEKIYESFGSK